MSQSDYIKYKKISTELKNNKLPTILDPHNYSSYKEYALENTIQNTKFTYNQLQPANKTVIFDIEKKVTNCPTFLICSGTNARLNRPIYPQTYAPSYSAVNPIRPLTQKQIQPSIRKTKLCLCTTI